MTADASIRPGDPNLLRAHERLQIALAAGKMGAWEWDLVTNRVVWSATLEEIHGIPVGSFEGTIEAYGRDIHPDDVAHVHATIERTMAGHPHDLEYRIVRPDGEVRWLEAHGRLIRDGEGRPLRLTGVCMDVTTRKLADLERARLVEELEKLAAFRQRLLGVVAHDLRVPLSAILASAEFLRAARELSPHEDKAVLRIRRSVDRMSRMITDLCDYTRGQMSGGFPVNRVRADMAEVVHRVVEGMHSAGPERAVHFTAAGDTLGCWDADRVAQVVANLVANALQHGSGDVHVEVRDDGPAVLLRVSNGGDPIPDDLQPRLFEPFARGREHGEGLGLGLYIVAEIVRAHGATVCVDSSAHEGTRVLVRWPRE